MSRENESSFPSFHTCGYSEDWREWVTGVLRFVANWIGINQSIEVFMAGIGERRGSTVTWTIFSRKIKTKSQCALRKFCCVRQQLLNLRQGSCSTAISWLSHGTVILPPLYFYSSCFPILGILSKVSWHFPPQSPPKKKQKQTNPPSFSRSEYAAGGLNTKCPPI